MSDVTRETMHEPASAPPAEAVALPLASVAASAQPWYAPGLGFACTQCGNCCSGPSGVVWLDDAESRAIADYLKISETEFRWSYARWEAGRWTLDEVQRNGQHDCVFLKRDPTTGKGMCSIYPVRPTQCRTWPFWPGNVRSQRDWEASAKSCPGMRQPEARGEHFVPIEQIRVIMAENPKHL